MVQSHTVLIKNELFISFFVTLFLPFLLLHLLSSSPSGRTAVHWAAMVDNLDALKLLVSHGPDTIKDVQNNKVRKSGERTTAVAF